IRRPSRLTSTICGPPASASPGAAGCAVLRTTPPRCTEPTSRGALGSETSNCLSSPVPQQETYSIRSSTERSMSVTSGGTAPNGCSAGGRSAGSAGSAGMVITFSAVQEPPSRCQRQTEADGPAAIAVPGAVPAAQAGQEHAVGAAVQRVRPGVAGLLRQLPRLDRLVQPRGAGVRLGVEDVDVRAAQAGQQQVAPLQPVAAHVVPL